MTDAPTPKRTNIDDSPLVFDRPQGDRLKPVTGGRRTGSPSCIARRKGDRLRKPVTAGPTSTNQPNAPASRKGDRLRKPVTADQHYEQHRGGDDGRKGDRPRKPVTGVDVKSRTTQSVSAAKVTGRESR